MKHKTINNQELWRIISTKERDLTEEELVLICRELGEYSAPKMMPIYLYGAAFVTFVFILKMAV